MQTKKDESETSSSVAILCDECLIQTFRHLSIADKMKIKRVCRRWARLSKVSWIFCKRLDCSFETWGLSKFPQNLNQTIGKQIFENVVRLCGRYVTSVSLSLEAFSKFCEIAVNIGETTENICELYLFDILPHLEIFSSQDELEYELGHWKNVNFKCNCSEKDWKNTIQWLLDHSDKITKLGLSLCHSYFKEEHLFSLFRQMKNLKSFHLQYCNKLNFFGTSLYELPSDIEEISLVDVQNLNDFLIASVIRKCRKLRKICLYRLFRPEINVILQAFARQAKSLRNIDLRISGTLLGDSRDLSQFLSNMSQLRQLEKLDFINAGGFVNDDFLEILAENCIELVHLNIGGKNDVTDKGISSISRLKNLLYLDICDIENIRKPPLSKLKNLQVLNCSNCINIEEEAISLFLRKSHNLRAINVRDCPLVTTSLLYIADNVINQRNFKKSLDFYIEREKVPVQFCYAKQPLLCMAAGSFEAEKYGFQNTRFFKMPHIRIKPNATTNR